MSCTVKVKYTNGAGNNIFQYVYSRLLAEKHRCNLSTGRLGVVGVNRADFEYDKKFEIIKIGLKESDHLSYFDISEKKNFFVNTYPENYLIYKDKIKKIKSWFPSVQRRCDNDLVFHLRLGDRLLSKNDHAPCMKVSADEYVNAINLFNFDRLHVVTDMKKWGHITEEELEKMRFHVNVPNGKRVSAKVSVDYFNSIVDALCQFAPKVRVNNTVKDDFDFMRSFNQILFQHGTLSWWAAALSEAEKVGVFGDWRPIKGKNNKNLGKADFPGWFQWGKK